MGLVQIILEENKRIREVVRALPVAQVPIYLGAYADAILYCEKLEQYKRTRTKKLLEIGGINLNDRR